MKRTIVLFLVIVLTFSMFAGCKKTDEETISEPEVNKPAETEEASDTTKYTEPVVIDAMWMYNWWSPKVWGEDPVTKKLTEETGVEFAFSAPAGDGNEKASVMLVTDDYPEVMWMDRGSVFQQYIDNGALYAIDVLAEEYGYDDLLGNSIPQVVVDNMRAADGHIYGIPNWFDEDGSWSASATVNVRNDILTEIAPDSLVTMDDLYSFLLSVKDANYELEGQKVYPLGIDWRTEWLPIIANLWGSQIDTSLKYVDEDTNEVKFYLRSDAAYESLKWLNQAYNDGLVDPENFSYQLQQRDEAYNSGKFAVVMGYFFDLWNANQALQELNENIYYVAVDAPAGFEGVKPYMQSYSVLGWNVSVITKNCEDPEAAIRFFDYYMSEAGQILSFYGIEGETWEMQDGKPMLLPGVYEAKTADWDGYGFETGVRYLDLNQSQKYNWEKDVEEGQRKADRSKATDACFNSTALKQIVLDGSSEAGIAWANIEASILFEVTNLVLLDDPASFDAEYQKLMENLEELGLSKVEAAWTELYN